MKIPADAIIPEEKITLYLLVYKPRNDKSKFLERAGFTLQNAEELRTAIRSLARSGEAIADQNNEYGTFYRVDGELVGNNEVSLSVTTIWLQRSSDGVFQFVTLKPS